MTKEETKVLVYVMLANCVMMGCFTLLAIFFEKWWIVLFSALFWKNVTYKASNKGKEDKHGDR